MRSIALILAAGASSRLGEPKSLVEINGKTVYQHTVNKLRKAGFKVSSVSLDKNYLWTLCSALNR